MIKKHIVILLLTSSLFMTLTPSQGDQLLIDSVLYRVDQLINNKDYDSALEALQGLDKIEDQEKPAEYYFYLGQVLYNLGFFIEAKENLETYSKMADRSNKHWPKAVKFYSEVNLITADVGRNRAQPVTGRQEAGNKEVTSTVMETGDEPSHKEESLTPTKQSDYVKTFREESTGMEFVVLPGGCFEMGSSDRGLRGYKDGKRLERKHRVCVKEFAISTHEITNKQYRLFRSDHDSGDFEGEQLDNDLQPVTNINWANAYEFAKWMSARTGKLFRLPTEAEWEYAARGGKDTSRFWGDDPDEACSFANVQDFQARDSFGWVGRRYRAHQCDDKYAATAPIKSYASNAFGLYDMIGNVWEWTCSPWDPDYSGGEEICEEEKWAQSNRVIRGGSWMSQGFNARSGFRMNRPPTARTKDYGFRLVMVTR